MHYLTRIILEDNKERARRLLMTLHRLKTDKGATEAERTNAAARADEITKKYGFSADEGKPRDFGKWQSKWTGPQPQSQPRSSGTAPWAWAGHSGGAPPSDHIYRNDYRDINHIKKTMWEKSGHSKEEHTVHQFDGTYFRHIYTAYGSEKIWPHMADAMKMWGESGNPYRTKAIFVAKGRTKTLHMIWANGHHVIPPQPVTHNSPNLNPGNDRHFTEGLSDWIDKNHTEAARRRARDPHWDDRFEADLRPGSSYKTAGAKPKAKPRKRGGDAFDAKFAADPMGGLKDIAGGK